MILEKILCRLRETFRPRPKFQNGMALVTVGRVTILIFETPEDRIETTEALIRGNKTHPYGTRMTFSDPDVPREERRAALVKIRKRYPPHPRTTLVSIEPNKSAS
jgi:predicted HAD superfamily phosphohydrolase